jgi:hypothetical protein
MTEPIDLAECRQRKQEEQEFLREEYARLCRHRHILMERLPIMNRHIGEIDLLLLDHPLIDDAMRVEIIRRTIYVLWVEYGEADAERKREILLSLREHYRALPGHYREEFWQLWWRWLDEFEEEEVANGTRTSRRYVWSPSARLGGCDGTA